MDPRSRRWASPRSDRESALEDVAPYRALSPSERLAEVFKLSRETLRLIPPARLSESLGTVEPRDEETWRRFHDAGKRWRATSRS